LGADGARGQEKSQKSDRTLSLKFDKLRTLLVEVEALLNARPLTYVHGDEHRVSYTLAPSHLMYGIRA